MGRLILAVLLAFGAGAGFAGCGGSPEAYAVTGGEYHIAVPEASEDPVPVVMLLHGYGGSGAGVMKNTGLVRALTARGYAVIAPDGTTRGGGRRSWVFAPFWQGRDENAFFTAVLADAARRFGIAPERAVLAGFSSGAFMVTYQACRHPESFAGFAPVAGGFWRPQPEACAGPVRLFHVHGWADTVVPLEGRWLGGGRYQQGNIFSGLETLRRASGCATHAPSKIWRDGNFLRRRWDCGPASDIELLLHPGGHRIPEGWAERMLDWFEAAGAGG
ncbi:alpha/beta hydrolase family esterase [Roseobacteraceae bacterium NS-SX3]